MAPPVLVTSNISAVEEVSSAPASSTPTTVAMVCENLDRKIVISNSRLNVIFINHVTCNLNALLDTRSPVSFSRPLVFKKLFNSAHFPNKNTVSFYKALNAYKCC